MTFTRLFKKYYNPFLFSKNNSFYFLKKIITKTFYLGSRKSFTILLELKKNYLWFYRKKFQIYCLSLKVLNLLKKDFIQFYFKKNIFQIFESIAIWFLFSLKRTLFALKKEFTSWQILSKRKRIWVTFIIKKRRCLQIL